jgi:protein-tyrosine phosphatase
MRTSRFALSLLLIPALLICCKPDNIEEDDNPNNTATEEEVEDLDPEIISGSTICVTSEKVEKFLTEVSYPERDYTETHIRDAEYGPACPGNSDIPPAFTIRWKADASAGALTGKLWEEAWSRDYTIDAGESYLRITNLRPNAHYFYVIKSSSGTTMTEGDFYTTGHVHQIFAKLKVRNARDLGGWKTTDGKTVKYRMVYRGGRMEDGSLNIYGKKEILAEGIRAQLDLRGHTNSGNQEYLDESALGPEYAFFAPCIEEGYTHMLMLPDPVNDPTNKKKYFADKTKLCFEFVVNCVRENKPVYFHCSLGRDRTGTLAMILLGVLGVREGYISQEYELTQFAPHGWATSEGESQKMTRKVDYRGAAMYIYEHYVQEGKSFKDGVEAFLLDIGVQQKDIDDFRNLMLE